MSQLIKPIDYQPLLDMKQTEQGIKLIKEFFQQNISTELRLRRVTAPLFVLKGLGINDDLNGVERAVSFPIKDLGDAQAEVVHSLAKWKRLSLAEYQIEPGYGIYTAPYEFIGYLYCPCDKLQLVYIFSFQAFVQLLPIHIHKPLRTFQEMKHTKYSHIYTVMIIFIPE